MGQHSRPRTDHIKRSVQGPTDPLPVQLPANVPGRQQRVARIPTGLQSRLRPGSALVIAASWGMSWPMAGLSKLPLLFKYINRYFK